MTGAACEVTAVFPADATPLAMKTAGAAIAITAIAASNLGRRTLRSTFILTSFEGPPDVAHSRLAGLPVGTSSPQKQTHAYAPRRSLGESAQGETAVPPWTAR